MNERIRAKRRTPDTARSDERWLEPDDGYRVTSSPRRTFPHASEGGRFSLAELRLLADLAELHAMDFAVPHRVVALVLNPLDWEASGMPACVRDARGRLVPVRVRDTPTGLISIDFEKIRPGGR